MISDNKPPTGYYRSPNAWEDQVFYFLLVDRFSDDKETNYKDIKGNLVNLPGGTPLYAPADAGSINASQATRATWNIAGGKYVGGTFKGITSKIGYLKRLGVTALWISPVFEQVAFEETYHGYGIQNFLKVNPRFGTLNDLKKLVSTAHDNDIYVILDIILNHSGDVFEYDAKRYLTTDASGNTFMDPRWDRTPYPVKGFRDQNGNANIPFSPQNSAGSRDAIWPREFQTPQTFSCMGRICNWDYYPEFEQGDFCNLKDIHHGSGDLNNFIPSPALLNLCDVYKYWMAETDIDGYRVDTVKHMADGAVRFFAAAIHEFAVRLGKDRFYLIAEITGDREFACTRLENTGLDAALGIADIPDKLHYMVKGYRNPIEYFSLFRNSLLVGKESHTWFNNKVVTSVDDHDQVWKGSDKARFCCDEVAGQNNWKVVLNALALNVLTLGIPCVYYGTEQYFNGHGQGDGSDRFIREAMFGGAFGSFESAGRHFFNEGGPIYTELAKILGVRRNTLALRRGRQYLREISGNGMQFGFPSMFGGEIRSVVPWSRILDSEEVLVAINTDYNFPQTAWVTLDANLHQPGDTLACAYSTNPTQIGSKVPVAALNGRAAQITVPAAGLVIFEKA
jgi:glycosidase